MQVTKIIAATIAIIASASAFADSNCEKNAKTRDDFLACSRADTDKTLAEAGKLYQDIRKLTLGDKQIALDRNFELWKEKISSDCLVFAYSFNDWSSDYSPDTDFQVAACRAKVASQELDFYKWLACPDDMETSKVPKCTAVSKALGENQ
ncbi:hypothetical protein P3T23_000283 [Paraburkholderia sp. GAS448]|uniref:hypothetical protein n=1 Tax=Paraburkholderia sp. GAS448 TaxID=3035136 RepID=UPI003D23E180